MSRQSCHAAESSAISSCGWAPRWSSVTRGTAVMLATGLLLGWHTTLLGPAAVAQQTPDSWTADRRAVLPSGLGIQFDFAPLPGIAAKAAPGKLATGGAGYADGLRGGDPATVFQLGAERPMADGSWRTLGTLQLSFGRAVRNPRLHLSGLAGLATGKDGSTGTASRLTVTGGSPSAPSLVARTDWAGWTVGDNALAPTGTGATDGSTPGSGTLELSGTVSTVTFRIEQRSTARDGSTTAPAPLGQAYTVTLDEGVGTAPQGYGNASHLVSDLFLGRTAAGGAGTAGAAATKPTVSGSVHRLVPPGGARPQEPAQLRERDQPMVELDGGAGRRSPWANPAPPELQPGRDEYQGADPTVQFPTDAAIGRYYEVAVPVSPGPGAATLAGWIDFDHNGKFDATERVQSQVPADAKNARLEWTVPSNAAAGETWARLRFARNSAQLVTPGGFADSGEVVDQRIRLTVGAARPEITGPVNGTVLADARPEIRGEAGIQGATVAIMSGDATLCRATVGKDGRWACRPDKPLPAGTHALTPVETTKGGVVLRGAEIRLTVKTEPPAAPVLTLPEFTNDPGLLLTGTGDPGSTVSVVDAANSPGAGRIAGELCSTAVAADRSWSCLPVENLADGRHQLTATATDGAGNRTAGRPVPLTVDTVAPPKPVLGSPAAGAVLTAARPRLTGRAEPGSTVTVTTRVGAAGERVVLCTALTGVDGAWNCTPARDLTEGDQTLVATATDRAGNATSAEAVVVSVRPAAPSASPSPSSSPSVSPSASASPSVMPTPSPSGSPQVASVPPVVTLPSVSPSPSVVASPSAAALSSPSTAPSPLPEPSVSPSAAASPLPEVSAEASQPPFTEPVLTPEEAAAILPIVVPPVAVEQPVLVPSPSAPVPASPLPSVPVEASASPLASALPEPSASPEPSTVPSASSSASPSVVPSPSASPSAAPSVSPSPSSSPSKAVAVAAPVVPKASGSVAPSPSVAADDPMAPEARNLAAPPAAAERPSSETWRTAACGVLLMLAALGLLTRRVFGRGPGGRRRS